MKKTLSDSKYKKEGPWVKAKGTLPMIRLVSKIKQIEISVQTSMNDEKID